MVNGNGGHPGAVFSIPERHYGDDAHDDSHGTSTYGGETEHGSGDGNDDASQENKPIAGKETRNVKGLRLIVMAVLICSAISVGLATYYYISHSEDDKFGDDFKGNAHKVLEAVGLSLEKTLKALDSLSVSLVSYAQATNQR